MSTKLYNKSRPENASLSCFDADHNITSVGGDTLKSYRNHQKQVNFGRATEEDELVKYMSNLPGYLERGKNIHEKVLNVGVLDWARLEQWQYRHKHGRSSTSSSNRSSCVSTEGLSGQSSKGHSSSPSHQRISRPSLQSYFMASTMQSHSQDDKSSGENVGNSQNFRGSLGNTDAPSKCVRADEQLSQILPVNRMKACNRKDLYRNIDMERVVLPSDQKHEEASCAKLEMGTQNGELDRMAQTLQEPNIKTVEQGVLRKSKPVLFMPSDHPQINHIGVSDRRTCSHQLSGNSSRTSFSERSKELLCKDHNYDISHSSPLPYEVKPTHTQATGSSSSDAGSIKIPAATSLEPLSAKMEMCLSQSREDEERNKNTAEISYANRPSQGLDHKVKSAKSRSSSPFGRFSFSIGFTNKVSGCKDSLHVPQKSSLAPVRSSSENVGGSASSYISGDNKPVDAGRSRSSPLRRSLDPVLKSKEVNQKDSALLSKTNINQSHLQLHKELGGDHRIRISCGSINTCDSSKEKKHVSSTVQARLRIAVKNGLPLFTFTVEKDSNILAATMKILSTSRKDDCSCIYNFFTFREAKKKNGSWMSQAGKSKGPNYIHQIVAQMKVSNSHFYDLTDQYCEDFTVKEFVLFSVELRQGDGQSSDYQPNDELAAIVVKIPKAISFINNLHQSSRHNCSQQLAHATVVLPSGIHSLPSRGGPSSLIERWKSGGSCDCGGWDLGCKLKVLVNENEARKNSQPSKDHFAGKVELFFQVLFVLKLKCLSKRLELRFLTFNANLQEKGQGNMPAFSLAPFRHGIYSVAFDSSLTFLQAFSICMALMDSKMPYELSGSQNSVEAKTPRPREALPMQSDGIKVLRKLEDIPTSYISYPPLSPVGRV